jgi:SAM-dependent methyltransferase
VFPSQTSTPESQLESLTSHEERYKMGQFFTPKPIAKLMGEAVREGHPETVLDAGLGGGILLRSVGEEARLFGIDLDPRAVELARLYLPASAELLLGDFLNPENWPLSEQSFDAIISNPPYVRHHNLWAAHKALKGRYMTRLGVKASSLSGSYVYFFLEALLRLRPGGRLVFITPTEFLDVRYGQAVKEALLRHCSIDEILVLEMDKLAFEGVLTTSAITVATKSEQPSRRLRLVEGSMNGRVEKRREVELEASPELPWTPLLPSRAERIAPLLEGRTATLGDLCRVRRGIATGNNSFFVLTQAEADEWGIEERFLMPAIRGARDLPTKGPLDRDFFEARLECGGRNLLFFCHEHQKALKGTNAWRYIEHGAELRLFERFNCKTRKPWYGVEPVQPADFFCTYMARENGRIVRNLVGARCMTSLLNVWAKPGYDPEMLRPSLEDPANARLLREFGRTYGGGLGKIEPGDLLRLPVRPPEGLGPTEQTNLVESRLLSTRPRSTSPGH